MATQSKKEQRMSRQALPIAPDRPEEVAPPPQPQPQVRPGESAPAEEPIAQWEGTRGDRFAYMLWLICFALLALHVLADTLLGWLFLR
jgi:hypothetical protein